MSDLHDRIAGLSPIKRMLLEKLRIAGGRAPDADRGIPRRVDGAGPLSAEQRRLWFMHRLAPGGPAYTIPIAFRLAGRLDPDALADAVRTVVGRHHALRLAFREVDGEPVQEVGSADRVPVEVTDLRATGDADARIAEFFARGFDLAREAPFRAMLVRTADDEHVLAMALHHVASDGASTSVLLRELSSLYAAALEGRDAHLPDPPLQLPDFAAWQRGRTEDADAAAWWRDALARAPHVLEVPADLPRPAAQSFAGSRVAFALPADVSRAVHARAAAEQASLFSVLAAALAVVLHRATGEDDLLIGTAVANRGVPGADAAVGFFANTLPLRIRVDRDTSGHALIGAARRAVAEAQDHAHVPFDRIVEAADVRRDPSRPPLVQVMISLDPAEEEALALPGIRAERISVDTGASPFDLTLALVDAPGGIRGELQYPTDLFEPATAERLAERFAAVLRAIASDPAAPVAALPLVAEEERRALAAWSRTGDAPADGCVQGLIAAQARARPDALALAWADQEVSYAELNRRANRVAHHLAARGIGAEARVGVLMARTPAMVAAFLGVLKAGAAYVPLDPRNPPARLASMLRAAGATALLVDRAHAGRLASAGIAEIAVESIPAAPGTADDPGIDVHPEQVACVIFTSGSTGGPKGVEIRHGSVFALMHWLRDHFSPAEREAMLAASSVGFDVTVAELFGPLSWGGAVMLVDDALSAPARPVRNTFMVPSVAAELLRADRLPPGVRTLMVGGEPLAPRLAAELQGRLPGARILNLYGPTECTVFATCGEVAAGAERITIGRPTAGTRAYVLDDGMRPCGIGEPGELWLGGTGVARGYAGRPALTAERFVPDPFGAAGARMYRTLDRARVRNDGTLEYRGRTDAQVKVHGVRIEPGEVEAALRAHPAVREAAVAVHSVGDAKQLVAYLVAADAAGPPPAAELRAFLRERLLEAMVPAAFVPVDELPRTTSGKLDRRLLPAPPVAESDSARGYAPPRDATEAAIAEAWAEVLEVERVGIHDDFFELGGHSLLALRLLARVRERLRTDLPVAALLQGPTVAQMARAAAGQASRIRLPVVVLQGEGTARPLFLVHAGGGHLVCYHPLAQLLAPDQPLYGLQARGLDDGLPPLQGAEAMAAYYLEGVRRVQPEGPYRLGGWSYGGMVAWEMARMIHADGGQVELLAMIDTLRPESRDAPGLALDHAAVLRRVITDVFGWGGTASVTVDGLRPMEPEAQLEFAMRRLGPRILPPERVPEVAALTRVRMANHNAAVDYEAGPYPGRLTYFRSRGSGALTSAGDTVRYWGRLADGFGLHEVAGSHGTLLQPPHVGTLADALRKVIAGLGGKCVSALVRE
jgi:amino acid adenylation domain-containing protein